MSVLRRMSGFFSVVSVILLAACSSGSGGGSDQSTVAKDQTITLLEDVVTPVTLLTNKSHRQSFSYQIVTSPAHGVLVDEAPFYQYVPAANYFGEDSFTFVVNDGTTNTNIATVSLIIESVNDAPVATEQSVVTTENDEVSVRLSGTDVEEDTLTYRLVTQPSQGTLTQGSFSSIDVYKYKPKPNYDGSDSFVFVANDGVQDSAESTVYITVSATNKAPVANKETLTFDEDTAQDFVLSGDDGDGEPLTYQVVSLPSNGTLTGTLPNLRYTPNSDYNGTDSFTFRVNDGIANSNSESITLVVNGINDAPVVEDVASRLYQDNESQITLIASDVDVNPHLDPEFAAPGAISWSYRLDTLPSHGVLTGVEPDLVYTPTAGFFGVDSFVYVAIDDALLESSPATVSLTIIATAASGSTPLNDTGITFRGNALAGNDPVCVVTGAADQDCNNGHDFANNDDADGHAGFRFTKLSVEGDALLVDIPEWSCVKDEVTGLIWEVKTPGNGFVADGGLHDVDDRYSWYSSDVIANGGEMGDADAAGGVCYGYNAADSLSYCNTQAYIDRVNDAGLCGGNDWRVPTLQELEGIIDFSRDTKVIDLTYFPNTRNGVYWSSSAYAASAENAWNIDFSNGRSAFLPRSSAYALRLVRTAPVP